MRKIVAFSSGLLFGIGFLLSDMIDPSRAQAFMNIVFGWDPTLIFVMVGGIGVMAGAWLLSYRRSTALFGGAFPGKASPVIDGRLIGGSAMFGIGWGLSGYCPGTVITGLSFGNWQTFLMLVAMLAGFAMHNLQNVTFTKQQMA